jgi:hypothetical protein
MSDQVPHVFEELECPFYYVPKYTLLTGPYAQREVPPTIEPNDTWFAMLAEFRRMQEQIVSLELHVDNLRNPNRQLLAYMDAKREERGLGRPVTWENAKAYPSSSSSSEDEVYHMGM